MERALLREICGDWRVSVEKRGRRIRSYAGTGARLGSCVVGRCERGAVDWRLLAGMCIARE